MNRIAGWMALCIGICLASSGQEHHHGGSMRTPAIGSVEFKTSCAPGVRDKVNTAVALLHSFEYPAARQEFLNIAAQDPSCAMAHWGAAMTYFHGAWGEVDQAPGAQEAATARKIADQNPATTTREKDYIAAVSAIYADANAPILERAAAFAQQMAKVHARNPQDDEASIFYALSLFESAGHDTSYSNQRRCGEILQPLFSKYPHHPGIAHYLIHCYDNAALAQQGLAAARAYANIAPDSAHAAHMPSHIFVRVGLWQETVRSNLASMEVAAGEPGACHGRGSQLHAMHFLQFAYLQLGREGEAKKVALQAMRLPGEKDCEPGDYVAASYALQAHDWDMAKRLNVQGNSDSLPDAEVMWTAAGIAAARTGDLKTAQRAAVELAAVRDTAAKKIAGTQNSPFEAARLEVEAWIAQAQGNSGKALEQMRRADEIGGYPSWAQPTAAEQLGDLLLEQHQAAAALAAYRKTLQNTPNLFNALYGAALAAERTGNASTAREYYRQLVAVAGDGDRREVAVAKKSLESQGP